MSNEKKLEIGSKPAFPYSYQSANIQVRAPGMDIRTYLAGQMATGLLANVRTEDYYDDLADEAVRYADALLARLQECEE